MKFLMLILFFVLSVQTDTVRVDTIHPNQEQMQQVDDMNNKLDSIIAKSAKDTIK